MKDLCPWLLALAWMGFDAWDCYRWTSDVATFKRECVARGVADWVTDQETGVTQFKWRPKP